MTRGAGAARSRAIGSPETSPREPRTGVVKLGIGITTYNRSTIVEDTIEKVRTHTAPPYTLIVGDDGSRDDTVVALAKMGVDHIAGRNRGVAWNKNRCLMYLFLICDCDVVILLEDDTQPNKQGWEDDWIEAARLYGHANFATPWIEEISSGSGTPADPYRSVWCSGQCSVFSRSAISAAGFMDIRFGRYGGEHVEHTLRLTRLGYGGEPDADHKFLLRSDLAIVCCDTTGTEADIKRCKLLYKKLMKRKARFALPFRKASDLKVIRDEMRSVHRFGGHDVSFRLDQISIARLLGKLLKLRLSKPASGRRPVVTSSRSGPDEAPPDRT